jgi:hypothetical protein
VAEFQDAIFPFLEPTWGCVGLKPNPPDHSTDNALLYSATYLVLSGDLQYENAFIDFVRACEVQPGIYHRYPGDPGDNAHDDLTGIAVAAKLFGLPFARDIHSYGARHGWCWNVQSPGQFDRRYFWPRIFDFEPTIKAAAGAKITFFDQVLYALALTWNTREAKEETSGKCLIYLKNKVMDGQGWLSNWAIRYWRRKMLELYPGGIRDVYAIYFGPDHPFAKFAPSSFA